MLNGISGFNHNKLAFSGNFRTVGSTYLVDNNKTDAIVAMVKPQPNSDANEYDVFYAGFPASTKDVYIGNYTKEVAEKVSSIINNEV